MSALLEFECQVPVDGYEVITHPLRREKSRVLQPRSERHRRFDLFDFNSSAFLEFAQTPATEDGIKDFADRYGVLNQTPSRIERWSDSIREMRQAVEEMHEAVEL